MNQLRQAAALSALLSCSLLGCAGQGGAPATASVRPDSSAPLVPHEIVVKYRAEGARAVTEDVEQWVAGGLSFRTATADASSSLDGLHRRLGVRGARALLPGRHGLSTKDSLALYAQRTAGATARAARLGLPPARRTLAELANVYVLELPATADAAAAAEAAARDPHVAYAQPNYVVKADFTPNDPYFSSAGSWGQPYDDLWSLERIGMPAAWDLEQGDGIVVGVVDSGLDLTHPDIAANAWQNPAEVPGNGIDDDANGYVDDVNGWSFISDSPDPTDDMGHGTHVSGTIAALGDNGAGVIGVAPHATILPVKALSAGGFGSIAELARAVVYAAQNGARVINNSWGCLSACPSNPVAEDAIDVAVGLGATVVFAAGNTTLDVRNLSPQNHPNVIVVAASDPSDERSFFSNYGLVDVAAPGSGFAEGPPEFAPHRGILSLKAALCSDLLCSPELVVGERYLRLAGTSMAAPHVAGLAALVLAQHPEYGPEQVRQVIRSSAVDTGTPGYDTDSGHGRIDAAAALAAPSPLGALITGPESARTSEPLTVTGTASGPGFASFRLDFALASDPATFLPIATSASPVSEGTLGVWTTSALPEGTHVLRLQVTSTGGAVYEDRQAVTFNRVFITAPHPSELLGENTLVYRAGTALEVRGTAALGGFESYALTIARSDGSLLPGARVTLPNGGREPVVDGLLGTWDTTGSPADNYQIVLTARAQDGATGTDFVAVIVDPTLHPGWPVSLFELEPNTYSLNLSDQLTAADLDGDEIVELACASSAAVTFFTHTGAELSGWPQSVDPNGYGYVTLNQAPAVADVTGDGALDVVAANSNGELFVWHADGELVLGSVAAGARFVAVDDMDEDGDNEIVTTGLDGSVRVWRYEDGELVAEYEHHLGDDPFVSPPALGDVDHDGKKEIAVALTHYGADYTLVTRLYLLGRHGTLPGWPRTIDDGTALGAGFAYPSFGDLDGDGTLEVAMSTNSGAVEVFRANGRRLPGWPEQASTDPYAPANSPILGDFDGDGRLDVIAGTGSEFVVDGEDEGHTENNLFAWHGDGSLFAGFPHRQDYPVGLSFFGFGTAALADVDGDGEVEAIVAGEGGEGPYHSLTAVKADGTTVPGFPKLSTYLAPSAANTSAVADFDGDGQLELAFLDANGLLYLYDLEAPASGARPWPMYQHDAQHTARADAPAPSSGLRARLRGGVGPASDARIETRLRLLNDTSSDVPLRELTLRYWYTDETAPSPQLFELGSAENEGTGASIPAQRVSSGFGRADGRHADRYLELGFAAQAGKLKAGGAVALEFTIRARNRGRYDERNDYSYRRSSNEANWKRVTVYRNHELVWGVEP